MKKLLFPLTFEKIAGLTVPAVLLALLALHLILPDKTYSSEEKRALQTLPSASFTSLKDGSFAEKLDSYTEDQFPLRAALMKFRAGLQCFAGNTLSNGVYYGKDGALIEAFDSYDEALAQETIEAMNRFVSTHDFERSYLLLVPTAAEICRDSLPDGVGNSAQIRYQNAFRTSLTGIQILDPNPVFDRMKEEGAQIYYKTDHHWTTDAAYAVFESVSEETGWVSGTFEPAVVTDSFSGSLVSKSGFTPVELDAVTIYYPADEDFQYEVIHEPGSTCSSRFFEPDALDSANAYDVFLGGNEPRITIRTTSGSGRRLLLFKDSYANCFIPFLAESYSEITVIDPRYYTDDIETLFLQGGCQDVLFLYNVSTLSADTNLKMVLGQ